MTAPDTRPLSGVLLEEHALLGASLACDEPGGPAFVASYVGEKDAHAQARTGALLCDLTGSAYLLASGTSAAAFSEAAFAGRTLAVGQAGFEACLSGDGSLLAAPLVLRCGDTECVVLDPSARALTLRPWLELLAGAGQDGRAAFPDLALEDASEMLVPLLLCGRTARTVLCDYVADPSELPHVGEVRSLRLDAIAAVAVAVDAPCDCYVLLVPTLAAKRIWRSLLSFESVMPVGLVALRALARDAWPWAAALSQAHGPLRVGREQLAGWDLMRAGGGFVGARGLAGSA